jgi:hypothetical protein
MSTPTTVTCCNGTYERREDGSWWYPWGERVPGAADLTVPQVLGVVDPAALETRDGVAETRRTAAAEEVARVTARFGLERPVLIEEPETGHQRLVVGVTAPELHAAMMLTVADVAELAAVSKATIDSYRYRGYLPQPQVVRGRTPLWARPVIRHWSTHRPGAGWRTDVYGSREHRSPTRTYPITRARAAAELRRRQRERLQVNGR